MKISHIILILLLFPLFSQGQYQVSWGEGIITPRIYPFVDAIEFSNEIYIARKNMKGVRKRYNNGHLQIERKSNDLKLRESIEQTLNFEGKEYVFEKFLVFNDKLYFFAWHRIERTRYEIVVSALDVETLLPNKLQFKFFSDTKEPAFFVTDKHLTSNAKLVIVAKIFSTETFEEELNSYILDSKLNVTFKHKSIIQLRANNFEIKKVQVDEFGNIYIVGFESPAKENYLFFPKSRKPITKGHLLRIDVNYNEEQYVPIIMKEDYNTRSIDFLLDDEYLYVVGLYSEMRLIPKLPANTYRKSVKGAFVMKSPLFRITDFTINHYPIDRDILHYSLKKPKQRQLNRKGKTKEMANLELKDVLFSGGNRILILAEVSFDYSGSRSNGTDYKGHQTDDIVVFSCDTDGDLIWMNNIPKTKRSSIDNQLRSTSYFFSLSMEKIDFFYMAPVSIFDDTRKFKQAVYPPDWNNKSGYRKKGLVHTEMNCINGEKTTELLEMNLLEDTYFSIYPKACFLLKNNDYLIYSITGFIVGKERLGILHFD